MSTYSIKDLENLSGIKAHTLRIWEQRYNFIKPKRTSTNIRYYDDQDLKLILNVSLLKEKGLKISKIAKMNEEEIGSAVVEHTSKDQKYPDHIHSLTNAMIDLDEERFEKVISTNILKIGFENTMLQIIFPFLTKTGVLWQTGSITPAQEHFISNLIRQKIIVAIDGQYRGKTTGKKFLLFLPEGELHELSLLFSNYILKNRGHQVVYMGQSLPFEDLQSVYKVHQPDILLSVFTSKPDSREIPGFISLLSASFPNARIFLSGNLLTEQNFILPENVNLFSKIEDLILFVDNQSLSM